MKNKIIENIYNLKYNIKYVILISIILIIGEQIFRYSHPFLTINLNLHKVGEQLLISFIALLMVKTKTIKGIYIFILSFVFIQYVHFNFYGTWVFPLEYLLFFTKFRETMETFTTVLDITILPAIIVVSMSYLIFKVINSMDEKRVKIPYLSYVLIIFLIFIPARVFFKDGSKKGARPNIEVTPIVNTTDTLGFFIGRILPNKIFGKTEAGQPVIATPKINFKNPDVNIVFIMGESLTCKPMSLFGEEEKTTPNLDKLKEDKNFTYQVSFASGVMTDISLPSFFNMLYQPDSTQQIISTNTCLFKMAKNNGFETYFYSAQCRDGLSNIKSYLCPRWIDNYLDATNETGDIKVDTLDNVLVDRLDLVDFNKSNFVVLHQIGSHSPVKLRYPKEFENFKPNPKDEVDLSGYKNTILYTDHLISQIIKKLEQKSKKPTYLFFTSDHGEGIDRNGGHGLTDLLKQSVKNAQEKNKATVFGYYVKDPERYGVAEFNDNGDVTSIEEKPTNPKSNYAVIGLYFYPNDVVKKAKDVKPSERGELEITTLNQDYLSEKRLKVELMGRGYAWLDTGTHESLLEASSFIQTIENRQSLKVACIEEIAYEMGYIPKEKLIELAQPLKKNQYGEYLIRRAKEGRVKQ